MTDVAGHGNFVKNLILGTTTASFGILVLSGTPNEFEKAISKDGKSLEQASLLLTVGAQRLIVVVNKMDSVEVGGSELFSLPDLTNLSGAKHVSTKSWLKSLRCSKTSATTHPRPLSCQSPPRLRTI